MEGLFRHPSGEQEALYSLPRIASAPVGKCPLASRGFMAIIESVKANTADAPSPSQPRSTEHALAFRDGGVREIHALFPLVGFVAAAWATPHVRRRNARQLPVTK